MSEPEYFVCINEDGRIFVSAWDEEKDDYDETSSRVVAVQPNGAWVDLVTDDGSRYEWEAKLEDLKACLDWHDIRFANEEEAWQFALNLLDEDCS